VINTEQWLQRSRTSVTIVGFARWPEWRQRGRRRGGPGWTAKDVLAHIVAWEVRVATHLPDLLADRGMSMLVSEVDAFNVEQLRCGALVHRANCWTNWPPLVNVCRMRWLARVTMT